MKKEGYKRDRALVSMFVVVGMVIAVAVPIGCFGENTFPYGDIERDSCGNFHKAYSDNITGNYEIYYTNDIGGNDSQDWNPPTRITNTSTDSMLLDLGIYLATDTIFIIWKEMSNNLTNPTNLTYYTISRDYGVNWTEPARSYEDISLKYAEFDPLAGEPELPPVSPNYTSPSGYYLVQMKTPIFQEWVDGIQDAGGILFGYIPNYAYIVKMNDAVKESVEELPFIRWIGIYHPFYKSSNKIRDIIESGGYGENITIDVTVFDNIEDVENQITALGGNISSSSFPYIRVAINDTKLYNITLIPDILWMQGMVNFTPTNDRAVNTNVMNVRSTWNNPMYPLTGSGQIIAILDTGLDTGDFTNWDDDEDGLIDEDPPGDINGDGWPGVIGDDDGDGFADYNEYQTLLVDEGMYSWFDYKIWYDDDEDGYIDEDPIDGIDGDDDGDIDEDPPGDINGDGWPGARGDDDGDGLIDFNEYHTWLADYTIFDEDDDEDGNIYNEDGEMHPDFDGKIIAIHDDSPIPPGLEFFYGRDYYGHGTLVAGCAVGNGIASDGNIKGVAYQADLVVQKTGYSFTQDELYDMIYDAYVDGARIHSNSWSRDSDGHYWEEDEGIYESNSAVMDEFMWDYKDMVILVSAGNDGIDSDGDGVIDLYSLGIPSSAKNVITVGATENDRPGMINVDNDGDGLNDEDTQEDENEDGWPGTARFDDDGDGGIDLNDIDIGKRIFRRDYEGNEWFRIHPWFELSAINDGINNDYWEDDEIDENDEIYYPYFEANMVPGCWGEDGVNDGWEILYISGEDGVAGTGDDRANHLNGIDDDDDGHGKVNQHPPQLTNVCGDGIDFNDPELYNIIRDDWDPDLPDFFRGYEPHWDDDEDGRSDEDLIDTYVGIYPDLYPSPPISTDPEMADNPDGMAAFSSRGPTVDGRIKPDVVAPGTWILSTKSSVGSIQLTPYEGNSRYCYAWGTSMSTPLTAGSVALIRQYYTDIQEHTPSAALLKATLINGAKYIPGQYSPTEADEYAQGWGRVDLTNSILPTSPRVLEFYDYYWNMLGETDAGDRFYITDCDSSEPLKITLAWTDPPSLPPSEQVLVNDLDLKVTNPNGDVYFYGNLMVTQDGEGYFSVPYFNEPPGGVNYWDNVENVFIKTPEPGRYKIEVIAKNIEFTEGPQPYSLVISYGQTPLKVKLYAGDNLISLPLDPDRPYIKEVLRSIDGDYNQVWYFDASDTVDPWKHYVPYFPDYWNDLWYLYSYMGFWIDIPAENIPPEGYLELEVYGTHFSRNHDVEIYPGWTMVGYPSTQNYRFWEEALNNLIPYVDIDVIKFWYAPTQEWRLIPDDYDRFEVGRGYWFWADTNPPTWIVEW